MFVCVRTRIEIYTLRHLHTKSYGLETMKLPAMIGPSVQLWLVLAVGGRTWPSATTTTTAAGSSATFPGCDAYTPSVPGSIRRNTNTNVDVSTVLPRTEKADVGVGGGATTAPPSRLSRPTPPRAGPRHASAFNPSVSSPPGGDYNDLDISDVLAQAHAALVAAGVGDEWMIPPHEMGGDGGAATTTLVGTKTKKKEEEEKKEATADVRHTGIVLWDVTSSMIGEQVRAAWAFAEEQLHPDSKFSILSREAVALVRNQAVFSVHETFVKDQMARVSEFIGSVKREATRVQIEVIRPGVADTKRELLNEEVNIIQRLERRLMHAFSFQDGITRAQDDTNPKQGWKYGASQSNRRNLDEKIESFDKGGGAKTAFVGVKTAFVSRKLESFDQGGGIKTAFVSRTVTEKYAHSSESLQHGQATKRHFMREVRQTKSQGPALKNGAERGEAASCSPEKMFGILKNRELSTSSGTTFVVEFNFEKVSVPASLVKKQLSPVAKIALAFVQIWVRNTVGKLMLSSIMRPIDFALSGGESFEMSNERFGLNAVYMSRLTKILQSTTAMSTTEPHAPAKADFETEIPYFARRANL